MELRTVRLSVSLQFKCYFLTLTENCTTLEANLKLNSCFTKFCTKAMCRKRTNCRAPFVVKHSGNHLYDAICDSIPTNGILNVTFVRLHSQDDRILIIMWAKCIQKRHCRQVVQRIRNVFLYARFAARSSKRSE